MITVYHHTNTRESFFGRTIDQATKDLADGLYQKVAEVNTDDLEQAFVLSNSIDLPWFENKEVKILGGASGYRSTSVGDVLDHNGVKYIVDSCGFTKIA